MSQLCLLQAVFLLHYDVYSIDCIDRLGRNTWILFCSYKLCMRSVLPSHRDHVERTFVVLPCQSLKKLLKPWESLQVMKKKLTILSKCARFTLNNFSAPSWCTWNGCHSRFSLDVWRIITKWIFATAQFSPRSTLIAPFYKS